MILGIDTSCYTTSVAVVENDSRPVLDLRRLLPVEPGKCGLRQSEALFCHIKALPELVEEALAGVRERGGRIDAVCVSAAPRPVGGSYMPVFLAGQQLARGIAAALNVPLFATSHQEGHIAAALWSRDLQLQQEHIAVHLSGGTSELLAVQARDGGYEVRLIGGADLAAGQFIDRVGVALGLQFPAGAALDQLAAECPQPDLLLTPSVRGTAISFSGPVSAAQRAIEAGHDRAEVAAATMRCVAASLQKALTNAVAAGEGGADPVIVLAGGVAGSQRLREFFRKKPVRGAKVYFADPRYSGDNAMGVALIGLKKYGARRYQAECDQ